jgi:hypothetical protein
MARRIGGQGWKVIPAVHSVMPQFSIFGRLLAFTFWLASASTGHAASHDNGWTALAR